MGHVTQAPKLWAHPKSMAAESKVADKYKVLEERLKHVEGFNVLGVDAIDMCLVPDMVIPKKIKVIDSEKYKGLNCLRNHLMMFCRKMVAYAYDEKLMIHYLQDILS